MMPGMGAADGLVALVTGGSRGIGVAVAQRLAAEGAAVAVAARTVEPHPRLPGTLGETVDAIEKAGGRAVAVRADLSEPGDRAHLVEQVESALGAIDILVNNAAAAIYMPLEGMSAKRFHIVFEVNVRAPFELAQLVIPGMRERRRGWILNISSATSRVPKGPPFDDFAVRGGAHLYGASKAALERLTAGLAAELLADGICVNSLSPVAAVLTAGAEATGAIPEEYRATAEPIEAMAEAALALCTPADPPLTGRTAYSLPLLQELDRPIRTLDGSAPFEPGA